MTRVIAIGDPSGVSDARRVAMSAALSMGFDTEDVGRTAIVATELATNLAKHVERGEILINTFEDAGGVAVDCIAVDRGAGIRDFDEAMRDGYSTAGSPGTGLGAIQRAAHTFDFYTAHGLGTAILARLRRGRPVKEAAPVVSAAIEIPQAGEVVSGDAAATLQSAAHVSAVVADGLGHGEGASAASRVAIDVFNRHTWNSPRDALTQMHEALASTRGAAVAIVHVDRERCVARFAGIGNVMAAIVNAESTKQMVSLHGTVGHTSKRIQEFEYPLADALLLIMCSDGVLTNWSMRQYPGLATRDPALIAAILYRDFKRGRDDLTVLVVRIGP